MNISEYAIPDLSFIPLIDLENLNIEENGFIGSKMLGDLRTGDELMVLEIAFNLLHSTNIGL